MTSSAPAWSTEMEADPDGDHFIAGAKGGYLMPLGSGPGRAGGRARLCQGQGRRLYRDRRSGADAQRRFAELQVAARQRRRRGSRRLRRRRRAAPAVRRGGGRKGLHRRRADRALLADLGPDHRQQLRARGCIEGSLWPPVGRLQRGDPVVGQRSTSRGSATVGKDQGEETSAQLGLRFAF